MAPKKKAGRRPKAAKHSKRTGTRKTAKAAARASATRKTARKSGSRKATGRASARKSTARKSTARKSTARKSTARKSTARKSTARKSTARPSIARRAAGGISTLRQSLVRSLPEEGVGTAVKEKARHGFELAREGLERLKDTTVGVTANVLENVKERIAGHDDRPSTSERTSADGPEPTR